MKKLNQKGFTLIELLAVITIMGILMLVAIPAVQRVIRNTRRDTFANTASEYIEALNTAVVSDDLRCCNGTAACTSPEMISSLDNHDYYYLFDSNQNSGKDLMEQGGTSSFGNARVVGIIKITKTIENNNNKYNYEIAMVDGTHGIGTLASNPTTVPKNQVSRGSVIMTGKTIGNFADISKYNDTVKKYACTLIQ